MKNFPKEAIEHMAHSKGDRVMFDISSVDAFSQGGNKFWLLVMDEHTRYCWSFFLKHKSDLCATMMRWLHMVRKYNDLTVTCFRCDNAGENLAFKNEIIHNSKYRIKFELTAPNTPQQNGKVERKFATLYGKVRSLLDAAGFPPALRHALWAQAANTATHLENVIIDESAQSASEKLLGFNPPWTKNLHTFGEIAIAYENTKIKSKLQNRGFPCMFIGYSDNHAESVFQFYNLRTRSAFFSRNVVWLHQLYGEYYKSRHPMVTSSSLQDTDDDIDTSTPPVDPPVAAPPIQQGQGPVDVNNQIPVDLPLAPRTRVSGIDRELRNLTTYYNPDPAAHMDLTIHDSSDPLVCETGFLMAPPDLDLYPKTLKDAFLREDKPQWWKAACTEFDNCETKTVWIIVKKSAVPKGRKIIGNRWVLTRKDDGRYRARTVAKGFSQIPGKDFQENHAPVVHDTTFHVVLVIKIVYRLKSRQFDIETAFLYGILEEEIYMEFPEGYEQYLKDVKGRLCSSSEHCVLLLRALYGLVQAARQWYKKITDIFGKLHFFPSAADPCLFVKKQC
jgi:Reverse transcriptase (RNA-dependent DNA polymerase)